MVIIVIPLGAVFSLGRIRERLEQARTIVVVLDHEMDRASGGGSEVPDDPAEIMQDRGLTGLHDGMNGVEPQAVEAIARQPVQRIADCEGASLRSAKVDGVPPRRMRGREQSRCVAMEIIPFGAEMIVDDVEKDHKSARVRGVDQGPQIVRAAIGAVRRVEQHAVIAPVAPSREVGDRHQFDGGQAGLDDVVELVDCRTKRAAGRECPDMKLKNGRFLPRPSKPFVGPPFETIVIDDLARPEHILRLVVRCRIRDLDLAIDAILVKSARAGFGYRGFVPTCGLCLHRMRTIQHHINALRRRSPETESDPVGVQLGAKAHACRHAAPENARTDRALACNRAPDGNSSPRRGSDVVSSSTVQRRYCASSGSVNSIASAAALSTM